MADMSVWKGAWVFCSLVRTSRMKDKLVHCLLEWSLQHHDGTGPTQPMSAEDRAWLEEAMQSSVVDLGKRMQELTALLSSRVPEAQTENAPASTTSMAVSEMERALDELVEIVEHVDCATDLARIGGLPVLLSCLACPNAPTLRAKAAEVLGTCVQNNAPAQGAFLAAGAGEALLPLLADSHAGARTKALFALSCQLRNHAPSQRWFCGMGGVPALARLLRDAQPGPRRKALQLLAHLVRDKGGSEEGEIQAPEGQTSGTIQTSSATPGPSITPYRQPSQASSSGAPASSSAHWASSSSSSSPPGPPALEALAAGTVPALAALLEDGGDGPAREAGLDLAAALAQSCAEAHAALGASEPFQRALQTLAVRLDAVPAEEWEATRDEVQALRELQQALGGAPPPPAAGRRRAGLPLLGAP